MDNISKKMLGLLEACACEEPKTEAESHNETLHKHAKALIAAVKEGNVEAVATALRGAFLVVDSEPHPEGDHMDGG